MARTNLDNLPGAALPAGFSFRWYQPGDEAHWLRIHLAADKLNEIRPELFQQQFGLAKEHGLQSALQELRERQHYLLSPAGEAIGTGTAWFNDNFEGGRWGRVHWMAILPEFQGRGLGKALLSVICHRLRELAHERAYLTTSTARITAIKLYRKFGFEPLIQNAGDEKVWGELGERAER